MSIDHDCGDHVPHTIEYSKETKASVLAAYHDEIWGETVFLKLAEHGPFAGEREKLMVLARLESETRARLKTLLARWGMSTDEPDRKRQEGIERAEAYCVMSWLEFVVAFARELPPYVARYRLLAENATDSDKAVLHWLYEHERVLLEFFRCESSGDGPRSLAQVMALMDATS
ncbi:hypothetical protein GNZ12_03375 [Paraburkholderia sp. 1N]|uniref:Uncharacterized protein n=1 Tax=Paraburkholderia solitsugae TaxID=2675748 RepID=A0ABX2BHE2_9BURK|nr:hypothetical protein [Paraburkholderia solitsugae]NPT40367.1 hypothetical protein [Paraburkholderia solitsugae]